MNSPVALLLKKIPFFQQLSAEALEDIAQIGRIERHDAGVKIFSDGDRADRLYVVLDGMVRIQKALPENNGDIRLATAASGDFFGEMALVDGSPRSATVATLTACEFFVISRDGFTGLLSECPKIIPAIFANIISKIRIINDQFVAEVWEKQKLREEIIGERYRTISFIASAANDASNTSEAMQTVVDQLSKYIDWPVGHVYVTEKDSPGALFSSGIWHLADHSRYERFRRVSEMNPNAEGLGIAGLVALRGKPAWVEDLRKAAVCETVSAAMAADLKSAFAFPVLVESKVAAVFEFFSDEIKSIDRMLLEAIEQIGNQLGRLIERKQLTEKLEHTAFHDPLTDLPNRALFNDHLSLSVARGIRDPSYLYAVLFVDLDRFKWINDSLGHQAGDELLVEVGKRLRSCVRTTDTIARLGGDEFGVLVEGFEQLSYVPRAIEKIRAEMQLPVPLKAGDVFTNASIGVALSTTGYSDPETVLRDADTAMYRAKSQGPGNYVVFDPTMHANAVKRLSMDSDLRRSLDRGELRLHYQPVVTTDKCYTIGFEALVRWQHPTLGLLAPQEFLPIAEDTDLIMPITEWVLEESCRQVQEWKSAFPTGVNFSVSTNLAPNYFIRREVYERIKSLLSKHSFDASSLKLEITEGQMMKDPSAVARMLARLSDLGIRVHIDDFGSGYSSLNYLASLRVAGLKIDQSFVARLGQDKRNSAIVRSITYLGENLDLEVIAEGVETEEQRDHLIELNCKFAQGFLFSRPLEPEKATRFLEQSLFPGLHESFPITSIDLGNDFESISL